MPRNCNSRTCWKNRGSHGAEQGEGDRPAGDPGTIHGLNAIGNVGRVLGVSGQRLKHQERATS